jgi:hypothetical protein
MNHEPQTYVDLQDTGNAQSQLLLQAVARHCDWDTGICHPSVAVLARMAKCSDKTVRRHLAKLEFDGFIVMSEREREDGSQGANKITLLGYAEWIKANRDGGNVPRPRKANRYERAPETQQNGPGQFDQGGGQNGHGQNAVNGNELAPDILTRASVKMTSGPGQQVTSPKNASPEQDFPPNPPAGGLSAKPVDGKWKADLLAELRASGKYRDAIDNLLAPLLASDKRLSLGKGAERGEALAELAQAAHGIPQPALAAALKRLIDHPHKLTPRVIRAAIDVARQGGAMFVVRPGMAQWVRWLEHYEAVDARQASTMAKQSSWQVPSEWPPAKQLRGAA